MKQKPTYILIYLNVLNDTHTHRLNCENSFFFTKVSEIFGYHNYELQPQENQVSTNEKQLEISWKNCEKPRQRQQQQLKKRKSLPIIAHILMRILIYFVYMC